MKKYIWISMVILLMSGCGSRKKAMDKESTKTETEQSTSGSSGTDISSTKISETTLSQFLEDKNLKITSNGTPYQLQYGSLIFSGSADVELSEKKEKIIYLKRYIDINVYHHFNVYQTRTNHKTETTYKSVDIDRAGISFVSMIWIVLLSMIGGAVLWTWLKSYLPKWRLNLFTKN